MRCWAEFGEELIAAFEQGAEGGVGEVGGLPGEDGDFKLDGLDGLLQAACGIGGLVPLAEGAVGVPAVLGELGDEGLLPLGQLRWLGCEGGGQRVALNEEGVDGASEVAGNEEFELGVGEEAVLRARVLEPVNGLLDLRDGIMRPGAIRGANEADDGIALLEVLGQHALHIMRGRVEAGLDDRLDTPLAEQLADSFCEGGQPGSGAGDEDSWFAGGYHVSRVIYFTCFGWRSPTGREWNRPQAATKVAEQMGDQRAGITVMVQQIGLDARNRPGEIRHKRLRRPPPPLQPRPLGPPHRRHRSARFQRTCDPCRGRNGGGVIFAVVSLRSTTGKWLSSLRLDGNGLKQSFSHSL